ncbi:MAG: hypothetical protein BGO98_49255 [Myxococcales bacterium 68-20]|nr:MAG: hypothetical protein BGO98_49255 [Myxococcales bacterium 68-20]
MFVPRSCGCRADLRSSLRRARGERRVRDRARARSAFRREITGPRSVAEPPVADETWSRFVRPV